MRDTLEADAEELQDTHAPEVNVKRTNAKEVIVVKGGDEFIFPCASGTIKFAGKDPEVRTSDQIW